MLELALLMALQICSVIVTWLYVSRKWLPNYTQDVIDDVVPQLFEGFKKQFLDPTVKKGFSLAGSLSGEVRGQKAVENKMATAVMDSQFGDLKMIAQSVLGIDVDGMIEEHGAIAVLSAIKRFLPMIQGKLPQNIKNVGGNKLP